jgi:hypothetical protein
MLNIAHPASSIQHPVVAMPIHVICPSCHARFKVGDQHAGKTGACPKCKGQIQIPAAGDEVVIHAPEMEAGAKDAKGRSVLKPIKRKETKFQLNAALVVGGAVVLTVAIAFLLGNSKDQLKDVMTYILAGGAIVLGPPLAYAGYFFLRDDEKDAFVGKDLLIRCVAAGLAFAATWGVYMYLDSMLFRADSTEKLDIMYLGILVAVAAGIGAFAAFVAFDFDPFTAFFLFALYFLSTALLRVVMGLDLLPGMTGVEPSNLPPLPGSAMIAPWTFLGA